MNNPKRSLCAGVLAIECVVLALSSIVLISVNGTSRAVGLGVGLGLAVAALLVAGLLRFEWAYYAGFAIQVAALALGIVVLAMIVLGLAFGALYCTAYWLGRKIELETAA